MGEIIGETVTTYLRGANLISNGTNYYLYNAHGDVVQLTDASGTVAKSYDYDAFGNEKKPDEDDANPFRYCGEYFDTATGLYYLRARYYDPRLGAFISEDPIRDGLNWYAYANNNPIRFKDPSGLSGILSDGSYYITHPLDEHLLRLKQEYETATAERKKEIAIEAQKIRESGIEDVDWSVRADRTLNYYLININVTDKLNALMKVAEKENSWRRYSSVVSRYISFALMVRPGGKYDLKSKAEWQGKEHFIYNGSVVWFDDPGNILYGYLGKAMGFDDGILSVAAGAVQILTGTAIWNSPQTFFDDPRDQAAIRRGMEIYRKTHKVFWGWTLW